MLSGMYNILKEISVFQLICKGTEYTSMYLCYQHNKVTIIPCFPPQVEFLSCLKRSKKLKDAYFKVIFLNTFPAAERKVFGIMLQERKSGDELPACRIIFSV